MCFSNVLISVCCFFAIGTEKDPIAIAIASVEVGRLQSVWNAVSDLCWQQQHLWFIRCSRTEVIC